MPEGDSRPQEGKRSLDVKSNVKVPGPGELADHYYLVGIDQQLTHSRMAGSISITPKIKEEAVVIYLEPALKAEAAIASVAVVAAADFRSSG